MSAVIDYAALAERRVRQQLNNGTRWEQIESYINRLELSDGHRSAIWMLAWSELPFYQRREIIMQAAAERRQDSEALHAQSAQAGRQSSTLRDNASDLRQTSRLGRLARRVQTELRSSK